jgi:hypothetical protein
MKTKLRRKSLHRSKNQRRTLSAASLAWGNETRRLNRIARAEDAARDLQKEAAEPPIHPTAKRTLRFRVTVECLTDGERVQFTAAEGPHGLTTSPTLAGRKVAAILRHYRPA